MPTSTPSGARVTVLLLALASGCADAPERPERLTAADSAALALPDEVRGYLSTAARGAEQYRVGVRENDIDAVCSGSHLAMTAFGLAGWTTKADRWQPVADSTCALSGARDFVRDYARYVRGHDVGEQRSYAICQSARGATRFYRRAGHVAAAGRWQATVDSVCAGIGP